MHDLAQEDTSTPAPERAELEAHLEQLACVAPQMSRVIVGQQDVVELLQIALLANGHCLLQGVPGLAKTLMVHALADSMHLDFRRVQFTPDMMPADLLGAMILQEDQDGHRRMEYQEGPVFTNVLLADEINRTPPKTQAALLEAMQERQISFGGETRALPKPFFVLATQNPVEQAGTYQLPEAQLDRFLMRVDVDYPNVEDEVAILELTTKGAPQALEPLLDEAAVLKLQQWVKEVPISDALIRYVADLVRCTRADSRSELVQKYVEWGAGPRAGQAIVLCAKARALLQGRFGVTIDDIKAVTHPCLRHRLVLDYHAEVDRVSADQIIDAVIAECGEPAGKLHQ